MIGSMASTPNPAAQAAILNVHLNSHVNSSVVTLSTQTMQYLRIAEGDIVLVENVEMKRVVPFSVATGDASHEASSIACNSIAGANLQTKGQSQVSVSKLTGTNFAIQIAVSPIATSFEGHTSILSNDILKPYFRAAARPMGVGDMFVASHADGKTVQLCITDILPAPYAIVHEETIIHTDGVPISQAEAEKWYEKAGAGDVAIIRDIFTKSKSGQGYMAPLTLTPVVSQEQTLIDATDHCPQVTTTAPKEGQIQHCEFADTPPPSASSNSPGYLQLQEVRTMPEVQKQFTASSSGSSSEGLWKTQSLTAVRDFAHHPRQQVVVPRVKQKGFKNALKNAFIPQGSNPGYDPHNY